MANNITTISLTDEDKQIIERYNLSPTALIKERLAQFKEFETKGANNLRELNNRLTAWIGNHERIRLFIEKKGLLDEYLKENV